jgi:L-seryl-tRNA(Ser) seleniumtransferase
MMDSESAVNPDPRRELPSVSQLAARLGALRPDLPEWARIEGARRVLAEARELLIRKLEIPRPGAEGSPQVTPPSEGLEPKEWVRRAGVVAERICASHPRPLVNATGVVLHTNLGRAPLAPAAADAVRAVAAGYSSLELDLETGRRGSRLGTLEGKLVALSGAEAAYACNNNAAAVLLALDTLARGREVVVSRGELVEIGGSFRVPDIMQRAGVRLVEVGTTNRTHPRDYERAIRAETSLLLKVHRSNFSQSGFVSEVGLEELVRIGRRCGLPVMEDLGSGTLLDLTDRGFPAEAFAPSRVALGADIVCFSGDKLLGGPQAGILLGTRKAMEAVRGNPLARALRLDKMSLAALDWTLSAYLEGRAEAEIPVVRQLLEPLSKLEGRAQALAQRIAALLKDDSEEEAVSAERVRVEADRGPVGGGSLPGFELDTFVVTVRPREGADRMAAALRSASAPVLTRIRDDAVVFDLRTLADADLPRVEQALAWLGTR